MDWRHPNKSGSFLSGKDKIENLNGLLEVTMKSYSQLGEDIYVFQNLINNVRKDLVIIEVGAYDGYTYSNTFALEEYHGCKCILVEPSFINVRTIYNNRPNASVHRLAVLPNFGVCEFVGHTPVSGVKHELSDAYMDQWKLREVETYKVMSAPLSVITQIENIDYIDFISIDVQGAEFFVLGSMNWEIPIGTICIELEGQRKDYDESCRGILRGMGFLLMHTLHISEFWCNPKYFRKNLLFDSSNRFPISDFEKLHFAESWQADLKDSFY
jgi:FkbM family methyltransferase